MFENEQEKEEIIFNNIHNFRNGYYRECKISDFCPDYLLHFPNNEENYFCAINRKDFFVESMKVFHYDDYGLAHFYAPKGTGKSILFRSILINFSNYIKEPERYTPLMFFNINLLHELILKSNINLLKKILLHESYSLFKDRQDSIELIKRINLTQKSIMKIILEIINIEIKEKKRCLLLMVILLNMIKITH